MKCSKCVRRLPNPSPDCIRALHDLECSRSVEDNQQNAIEVAKALETLLHLTSHDTVPQGKIRHLWNATKTLQKEIERLNRELEQEKQRSKKRQEKIWNLEKHTSELAAAGVELEEALESKNVTIESMKVLLETSQTLIETKDRQIQYIKAYYMSCSNNEENK